MCLFLCGVTCGCRCCAVQKRALDHFWAGVTGDWVTWHGYWELEEQKELWNTRLLLPLCFGLWTWARTLQTSQVLQLAAGFGFHDSISQVPNKSYTDICLCICPLTFQSFVFCPFPVGLSLWVLSGFLHTWTGGRVWCNELNLEGGLAELGNFLKNFLSSHLWAVSSLGNREWTYP